VLAIFTHDGGRGGTAEDGGEDGEASGGVGGGGTHRILCLIKLIALLGEIFTRSSLSPHGGEIKGLVYSSALSSGEHQYCSNNVATPGLPTLLLSTW